MQQNLAERGKGGGSVDHLKPPSAISGRIEMTQYWVIWIIAKDNCGHGGGGEGGGGVTCNRVVL